MQVTARTIAHLIVGRILTGVGVGIMTSIVPTVCFSGISRRSTDHSSGNQRSPVPKNAVSTSPFKAETSILASLSPAGWRWAHRTLILNFNGSFPLLYRLFLLSISFLQYRFWLNRPVGLPTIDPLTRLQRLSLDCVTKMKRMKMFSRFAKRSSLRWRKKIPLLGPTSSDTGDSRICAGCCWALVSSICSS